MNTLSIKKHAVAGLAAFASFALLSGLGIAASTARQVADKPCDRACLKSLVDSYLTAVAAHDPTKVQLAPDLKFVENLKRLKTSEGLWKTATAAPTTFKIYVPDAIAQQVGLPILRKAPASRTRWAARSSSIRISSSTSTRIGGAQTPRGLGFRRRMPSIGGRLGGRGVERSSAARRLSASDSAAARRLRAPVSASRPLRPTTLPNGR